MPAAIKSKSKKTSAKRKKSQAPVAMPDTRAAKFGIPLIACLSGAFLGLSAPGHDFWFIAWFGLVPFLLLVASAGSLWQSALRGFAFGVGYNPMYLSWLLGLHPLTWLGFSVPASLALSYLSWVFVVCHQGLVIGLCAAAMKLVPMAGGFLATRKEDGWKVPAALALPFLWTLIVGRLGNNPDFLGLPWSMLEYTQYQQLPIIQMVSLTGGAGLGFLIVMVNAVIAGLIATISARQSWQSLASSTRALALRNALLVTILVLSIYAWGQTQVIHYHELESKLPSKQVAVLQGNISVCRDVIEHHWTLAEMLVLYKNMAKDSPADLIVWSENALPTYLPRENEARRFLSQMARELDADMLVGSLDETPASSGIGGKSRRNVKQEPYNSAFAVTRRGEFLPDVYHKRFLVPFGEYMPAFVKYMPEFVQRLTATPAGGSLAAGKLPVVFHLGGADVAPLVCFESISSELVTASARKGSNLIVNNADLGWFHASPVGDQMIAFATLRAVENRRYFVFANNTGPSAIIDLTGSVKKRSGQNMRDTLMGRVRLNEELTPFQRWSF